MTLIKINHPNGQLKNKITNNKYNSTLSSLLLMRYSFYMAD